MKKLSGCFSSYEWFPRDVIKDTVEIIEHYHYFVDTSGVACVDEIQNNLQIATHKYLNEALTLFEEMKLENNVEEARQIAG